MKKIAIIFGILAVLGLNLSFDLHAAQPRPTSEDLKANYEKNKDSVFDYKGLIAIALNKDLAAVIYDKNKKLDSRDYIKFDPYLGLYLVRMDRTLRAPFMMDELGSKNGMWVNVLDANVSEIGHIKEFASNLGEFDELSFNAIKPGMLLCDCGNMLGIALGGNKFIGNRYIKHFLKDDDVSYGDIGVEFGEINGTIVVKSVSQFSIGKELLKGDQIVSVNDKAPANLREMNELILFSAPNTLFKFEIKRGGENHSVLIGLTAQKPVDIHTKGTKKASKNGSENAGNVASAETPKKPLPSELSKQGISLNPKTNIISKVRPGSKAAKAGFRAGDKIIAVDRVPTANAQEIEKILKEPREKFYFLVSRNDFQFFIRVYK